MKALSKVLPIKDRHKRSGTNESESPLVEAVGETAACGETGCPAEEQKGAIALLQALEALAPVSRASFNALREATALPDANLVRALLILEDAGLVKVQDRPIGASARSFALSDRGREVVSSPREKAAAVGGQAPPTDVGPQAGTGGALRLVEGALPAGGAQDLGVEA